MKPPARSRKTMTVECPGCGVKVKITYPANGMTRAKCGCGQTCLAIMGRSRIHITWAEKGVHL